MQFIHSHTAMKLIRYTKTKLEQLMQIAVFPAQLFNTNTFSPNKLCPNTSSLIIFKLYWFDPNKSDVIFEMFFFIKVCEEVVRIYNRL